MLLIKFRKAMAAYEASDGKSKKVTENKLFKIAIWIFFGKKSKLSYQELTEKGKVGLPVRPLGAVMVVLALGLAILASLISKDHLTTALIVRTLEKVNGAEVEADSIVPDPGARVACRSTKLVMADASACDHDMRTRQDLLRADALTADVSMDQLLRGRIALDEVVISGNVQINQKRQRSAQVFQKPEAPTPPVKDKPAMAWLTEAEKWQKRLQTAQEWLDKISWDVSEDPQAQPEGGSVGGPTWRERLAEQAKLLGYANVRAAHVLEDAPRFEIRHLEIQDIQAEWPKDESITVTGDYLATEPLLASGVPALAIQSTSGTLNATVRPRGGPNPQPATMDLTVAPQPLKGLLAEKNSLEQLDLSQATFGLNIQSAELDVQHLNLPMVFDLDGVVVDAGGEKMTLNDLPAPLTLSGQLGNPGMAFDTQAFFAAVKEAGGDAALQAGLAKGLEKLNEETDGKLPAEVSDAIGGLLGGKKAEEKPQENTDDTPAESNDSTEEVGDTLRGLLGPVITPPADLEGKLGKPLYHPHTDATRPGHPAPAAC